MLDEDIMYCPISLKHLILQTSCEMNCKLFLAYSPYASVEWHEKSFLLAARYIYAYF